MKTVAYLVVAVLAAQVTSAADIFARSLASEFPSERFGNDSAAVGFSVVSRQGVEEGIFRREQCVNAGYEPCSNVPNKCCPAGYDCFAGFVCCTSGRKPCPNNGYCYDPPTEQCCTNVVCKSDETCCGNGCCNLSEYCGDNGWCSACPPAVESSTKTVESTTLLIVRTTVTEVEEPEEASGFSCAPVTVTNAQGGTLELDEECALSYNPPSTTSTTTTLQAANNPVLRARTQASCTPLETSTEIITVSDVVTSFSRTTITITTTASDFSCPTMAVTNSHGDVLSLGKDCSLGFEPGSSTAGSTASGGGGPVSTGGSERSSGQPLGGWWMVVAGFWGVF